MASTSISDLPLELLERILSFLRPDLQQLVQLSGVSRRFRAAAIGVPIPVHIPLPEESLLLLRSLGIPLDTLCSREPSMFVKHQIPGLNLGRLRVAEVTASDYITNKSILSPHYVEVLGHLARDSAQSLRQLLLNCDLVWSPQLNGFRCSLLVTTFRHLTFLSLTFTSQIELQQKVLRRRDGQTMIKAITDGLRWLKTLYIFHCPTDRLVIHSDSLERLHIYKSDFAGIAELRTKNLRKLVFHDTLVGETNLLTTLFEGCPLLESFNMVDVGFLRGKNVTVNEWGYSVLKQCYRKKLLQDNRSQAESAPP